MKCSLVTTCSKSKLEAIDNQIFCFNCYGLYEKDKINYKNRYKKLTNNSKLLTNKRLKYLRKNFSYLHNNIILFLNESIEKIKNLNNLKRISNERYINSLYKFYCQKYNIYYKPLVDKQVIKLDDNIITLLS